MPGKRGPNRFLVDFLKNFAFSCSWKPSKMETNVLLFHCQSHIWQKSSSWCCQPIKFQYSLKCNISIRKSMMKCVFCMQINIEVLHKLIQSFWVCATRHAQSIQNKFAYLCNISRKAREMKLICCLQINRKVFYKLIVSLWACLARHAQSTQNNKFTISL